MRSPFKFLDSYTRKDRSVFFGRDKEIALLYEMVHRNPLTLVYGLSGTGKSSLIQCGLASRFDGPDWYPLFIRRGKDINESLGQLIMRAVPKGQEAVDLAEAIRLINERYLRPIYLIFDQFEELFVLGTKEEQGAFVKTISELLDKKLSCHIILIMREEYLGNMYEFERHIPHIFENRMRVERMGSHNVQKVISSSFQAFNMRLAAPEGENMELIVDNISQGKSGVQLPFLQVYLDMMYREDFLRTYSRPREGNELPDLEIITEEIDELGRIDDVLNRYLEEQYMDIPRRLGGGVAPKEVKDMLDIFVSEEGTKIPIPYTQKGSLITLAEAYQEALPAMGATLASQVLTEAEKSRILRFSEEYMELSHDSLAKAINDRRTDEQRQLNEVKRSLKSSHLEYERTGQHLSKKQLDYYEEWLPKLNLAKPMLDFIAESKEDARRIEKAKKRQQRIRLGLLVGIAVVGVLAAVISGAFYMESKSNAKYAAGSILDQFEENIEEWNYKNGLKNLRALSKLDVGQYKDSINHKLIEMAWITNKVGARTRCLETMNFWAEVNDYPEVKSKLGNLPEDFKQASNFISEVIQDLHPTHEVYKKEILSKMILVEGGTFQMGCDENIDPGCGDRDDEILHTREVSNYYISSTETTWLQYMVFRSESGYGRLGFPEWLASENAKEVATHPVVNVSWYAAARYCNWLSVESGLDSVYVFGKKEGSHYEITIDVTAKGFRLPSEGEWEYAAKGGKFKEGYVHSGSDIVEEVAWYKENAGGQTHPVGLKKPNALGLYDMSGNAYEWCEDWYAKDHTAPTKDYRGPSENKDDKGRMVRGGAWVDSNKHSRVSYRTKWAPQSTFADFGFRVVVPQSR